PTRVCAAIWCASHRPAAVYYVINDDGGFAFYISREGFAGQNIITAILFDEPAANWYRKRLAERLPKFLCPFNPPGIWGNDNHLAWHIESREVIHKQILCF